MPNSANSAKSDYASREAGHAARHRGRSLITSEAQAVGDSELRWPLDAFRLGVLQTRGRADVLGGCHADGGDH